MQEKFEKYITQSDHDPVEKHDERNFSYERIFEQIADSKLGLIILATARTSPFIWIVFIVFFSFAIGILVIKQMGRDLDLKKKKNKELETLIKSFLEKRVFINGIRYVQIFNSDVTLMPHDGRWR